MYFSEETTNAIALKRAIEEAKKPNDIVDIKNSIEKGQQIICVEIGSKKFSSKGETEDIAIKLVTKKIKNYKPAIIKRRFGKMIKTVKAFKRA